MEKKLKGVYQDLFPLFELQTDPDLRRDDYKTYFFQQLAGRVRHPDSRLSDASLTPFPLSPREKEGEPLKKFFLQNEGKVILIARVDMFL